VRGPVLLLAGFAVVFSSGSALAWTPVGGPPFVVWPKIPVPFYINEGTLPPELGASAKDKLLAGFAAWSAPRCTFFAAELLGDLPGGTFDAADDKNVLLWVNRPDPWPMELGLVDSIIGTTVITTGFKEGREVLVDADIVFNNVGFCWFDYSPAGPTPCDGGLPVDTLSIITHEEGHFLGLGHSVAGATMQSFYKYAETQDQLRTLEQDDIDGVCGLYPVINGCDACGSEESSAACQSTALDCGGACGDLCACVNQCPNADVKAHEECRNTCKQKFPDNVEAYDEYVKCLCEASAGLCSAECARVPAPPAEDDPGCGCELPGSTRPSGALLACGIGLAALVLRRRRASSL